MGSLQVSPSTHLKGSVRLPGDKSLSHRAALFAALAEGESHIENFLNAGVTQAMLRALTALSIPWELHGDYLTVKGSGLKGFQTPDSALNCGNSATTLRLLAGALVAAGTPAVLDGTSSLRRRPMQRIIDPLSRMGARIESTNGCAPIAIQPAVDGLVPIDYELPIASAQVKTCIMLAGLAAPGTTTVREPGFSRDHTERMLGAMGVEIRTTSESQVTDGYTMLSREAYTTRMVVPPEIRLRPLDLRLPGDISSAAFLIVAGLISPGSEIWLEEVCLNPGRTGMIEALQDMGADILVSSHGMQQGEPVGDIRIRSSQLTGGSVSGSLVVRMIDEFPAFAVAAVYAHGETVVCDASELRHKESDRISTLCSELRLLGCDAEERPDGFVIRGKQPLGGEAKSGGDHRLAMALSLVGLASQEPVVVHEAEIIAESFPGFTQTLRRLGARVEVA